MTGVIIVVTIFVTKMSESASGKVCVKVRLLMSDQIEKQKVAPVISNVAIGAAVVGGASTSVIGMVAAGTSATGAISAVGATIGGVTGGVLGSSVGLVTGGVGIGEP